MQTTEHFRVTHEEGRGGERLREIVEGAINYKTTMNLYYSDKHFIAVLHLHLILVSLPFFKSTVNRWTSGFLGYKIAGLYVFDTIFYLTLTLPLQ